jgi:DNA polymerase-3 subunit epsilon
VKHIAIDTETTGFSSPRVIELAAVEFDPLTGACLDRFHAYLDPRGTPVEPGAFRVHGLSDDFLRGRPSFTDTAPGFVAFVAGARLYAHNAPFDQRMLDAELARIAHPGLYAVAGEVVCTLAMANQVLAHLPRKRLDDLCDHFGIDRGVRQRHGALVDCELLAQVAARMGRLSLPVTLRTQRGAARASNEPSGPRGVAAGAGRAGWKPGGPWLPDETEALRAAWAGGDAVAAIALRHNRSVRAIAMQLHRLGEVAADAVDGLIDGGGAGRGPGPAG